jgi:uncharacterized cupredoxin-like copper-binding protein
MSTSSKLIVAVGIAVLALAAAPIASSLGRSESTDVTVTATEYTFDSSQTTFSAGQVYHFVVANEGALAHDWMIIARGEQDEEMALTIVEDEDFGPGTIFTIDFSFPEPGNYEFACHVPDHYEAGMVRPVTVN